MEGSLGYEPQDKDNLDMRYYANLMHVPAKVPPDQKRLGSYSLRDLVILGMPSFGNIRTQSSSSANVWLCHAGAESGLASDCIYCTCHSGIISGKFPYDLLPLCVGRTHLDTINLP